ncbi:YtxH domain-containing protein [Sansalvadorimonas verongulae]|uniref:YtxH domain-containing protein n=1 Tax=Sansalvadorimonas verongulae TaxID=2172824 RepID=UPI0012BBD1A5|nr:YtxH domain-containing protein [Sansalvadorimonas verongulae]MTI13706.1 YtxH domain-containing protein [Sansalvadorimonas verongulae]
MSDKPQVPPHDPQYGYGYPPPWAFQQPVHPAYAGYHQHHGVTHTQMPPAGYPYPPHMHHGQPHYHQPAPQQPAPQQAEPKPQEQDAFVAQSQHMLENMLGEQSGLFKDLVAKLGMDDREFWKGAMIGAAAALIFSNENVRSQLMSLLGNAGDMLKTSGGKIKQGATNTASSVTESVAMGSDVFRDTFAAGKAGFRESVERQRTPTEAAAETTAEQPVESNE